MHFNLVLHPYAFIMNFDRSWARQRKPATSEKIKEKVKTPQPLKPRVEFSKKIIKAQSQKFDKFLQKLKDNEK